MRFTPFAFVSRRSNAYSAPLDYAERLIQIGGSLLSLSHVTVYLSAATMPHYKTVNRIYATMFGTSPPTRACVGVNFTEADSKIRLKLEVEGRIESGVSTRRSLHVQSLSYWTAANIGPYSQAIVVSFCTGSFSGCCVKAQLITSLIGRESTLPRGTNSPASPQSGSVRRRLPRADCAIAAACDESASERDARQWTEGRRPVRGRRVLAHSRR